MKNKLILVPTLLMGALCITACEDLTNEDLYPFAETVIGEKLTTLTDLPIGAGGLSLDSEGYLYASHFGQGIGSGIDGDRVLKIDPKEGTSEVFATGFVGATGSDFDSQGNFYQASFSNSTLYKVDTTGNMTAFATEDNGLFLPVGVVIDDEDNVYVNNCGGGNVTKLSAEGEAEVYASSELFKCANGITIDDETGIIYVANFSDGSVLAISTDGVVSLLATLSGGGNGHLTFHEGSLYVAQFAGNKISKVSLTGEVSEFIGSGNDANEDGKLLTSSIRNPNDLVFDESDNLFIFASANEAEIGDSAPSVIRKVIHSIQKLEK